VFIILRIRIKLISCMHLIIGLHLITVNYLDVLHVLSVLIKCSHFILQNKFNLLTVVMKYYYVHCNKFSTFSYLHRLHCDVQEYLYTHFKFVGSNTSKYNRIIIFTLQCGRAHKRT
jgi:hypothetical protein